MHKRKSIKDLISALTVDQKLSQLFIVGYYGVDVPSELLSWIDNYLGGVVFFRDNIKNIDEIAKKNMSLQAVSELGLFTAIDQEGGLVERIKGATQVPAAMALAATQKCEYVQKVNEIIARELHLAGFNLNFTPVLDVNTCKENPIIGVRSFGESTQVVADYGMEVIKAMRKHKVIPVAKHFPGHGPVNLDSHLSLPVCNLSAEELMDIHLPPFCKAIDNSIEMIMLSHVAYTAYNHLDNVPASLSYEVVELLLRQRLAYDGVLITDDLNMKAVASDITIEDAAVRALQAGVDLLLYRNYEDAILAYKQLLYEIDMGNISIERIDESLERIITLKKKYNISGACYDYQKELLAEEVNKENLQTIFNESITVIKSSSIDFSKPALVVSIDKKSIVHYQNEPEFRLSSLLPNTEELQVSLKPDQKDFDNLSSLFIKYENIIVVSYNASFHKQQEELIRIIPEKANLYLLAAGSPFDIELFPDAQILAMSYGYGNSALTAFASFLLGEIRVNDKSPVELLLKT